MAQLNTNNFEKVSKENTKQVEEFFQKALFKVNDTIGEEVYEHIYPSRSNSDKLEKLSLRPIVSNIGTATHKTAEYLRKLLTQLSKSMVESTKDFVAMVKKITTPEGYHMVSFDGVNLFTNVPLNKTIDIILLKVYNENLISTKLKRHQMKKLLLLCTQGVPFTFNGEMYMQGDGVVM